MKKPFVLLLTLMVALMAISVNFWVTAVPPTLPPVPLSEAEVAVSLSDARITKGVDTQVSLNLSVDKSRGLSHLDIALVAPEGFSLISCEPTAKMVATDETPAIDGTALNPFPVRFTLPADASKPVGLGEIYRLTYRLDWDRLAAGTYEIRFAPLTEAGQVKNVVGNAAGFYGGAGTITVSAADAAPAPAVSVYTDSSVTLVALADGEYKCSAYGVWQDSPTFTGLTGMTEYAFYQRTKNGGTPSVLYFVTKPSPPVKHGASTDSISLCNASGYEYQRNGGAWQANPNFENLEPDTAYTFRQRTRNRNGSWVLSDIATIATRDVAAEAPTATTLTEQTDTEITLVPVSGHEYRINGGVWQDEAHFEGLAPATGYLVEERVKETVELGASPNTPISLCTAATSPTVVCYTNRMITLKAVPNAEYQSGNGIWQTEPVFENLDPDTTYTFSIRMKQVGTDRWAPLSRTTVFATAAHLIGDVDESGSITTSDRIILSRYLADWQDYKTQIDLVAADVDRNERVATLDRIILSRYSADWHGEYDSYFVEVYYPD